MNTDKIYAEQLANEYTPKDTSKVAALRRLDARAKRPANVFTYTFGAITSLVAGLGMCLSMRVIVSGDTMFVLGIIIGLIGFAGMGVNYPIYKKLLEAGKAKYAFQGNADLRLFSREKAHKFKLFSRENSNYSAYPWIIELAKEISEKQE